MMAIQGAVITDLPADTQGLDIIMIEGMELTDIIIIKDTLLEIPDIIIKWQN